MSRTGCSSYKNLNYWKKLEQVAWSETTDEFRRTECVVVRAIRMTTRRDRITWIASISKSYYGLIMLLLLESLRAVPWTVTAGEIVIEWGSGNVFLGSEGK